MIWLAAVSHLDPFSQVILGMFAMVAVSFIIAIGVTVWPRS